jgi:hypothetical protein
MLCHEVKVWLYPYIEQYTQLVVFFLKTIYTCSYINTNTTYHCFKIRDIEQQMVMQSGYMEELEVSMYFIDA